MTTTTLSALGQAALSYADRGWKVFPLLPRSKDPLISQRMGGKGFHDGTTNAAQIARWWTATPDANIGLNLIGSGLVCVDADTYKPECEWAGFIAGRDMPETLIQRSARGGTHYLFTAPPETDFSGHLCEAVDIKHKGYIILEPSVFEGAAYRFETDDDPAPAPGWLLAAVKPKFEPRSAPPWRAQRVTADLCENERMRAYCDAAIAAELEKLRNAPAGRRNETLNEVAFSIGTIVGAGFAGLGEMIEALTEAGEACGIPRDERKAQGTIARGLNDGMAKPRAFPMDDEPPFDAVAVQAVVDALWNTFERKRAEADRAEAEEQRQALEAAQPYTQQAGIVTDYDAPTLEQLTKGEVGPMPSAADDSAGVLREVFNYVRDAMRRDWPEAAFLVALNITGACIGRNFATWTNLRSNLYTVVLAKSGWGKSSIYGPAVDLLIQAGLKEMIGAERIMSDSGLIQEISSHHEHKKIYFLDEFGHMLQQCNAKGAAGHMRKIVTEFTNLYSKASGYYSGAAYADGRQAAQMDCPHLNVFGMATPGQFWEAFGSGAIADGTLPRFSILKATSRPARKKLSADHLMRTNDARDRLAPKISALAGKRRVGSGNLAGAPGSLPQVVMVMPDSGGSAMYAEIEDLAEAISIDAEAGQSDRDIGGILARVAETAAKISLIYAVSRNPDNPVITETDMRAGRRLAWWFAHVAIEGTMLFVNDNEHQARRQKVLAYIRKGEGGRRKKREVVRNMDIPTRDLDDIMRALFAAELVMEVTERGKSGPPAVYYMALAE